MRNTSKNIMPLIIIQLDQQQKLDVEYNDIYTYSKFLYVHIDNLVSVDSKNLNNS